MTSYFYPSIVAPLDGLSGQIHPVEVCSDVVMRNPYPDELDLVNRTIALLTGSYGIKPMTSNVILMESKTTPPQVETLDEANEYWHKFATSFIEKGLTLLRLAHPGPVNSRFFFRPLANVSMCGYSIGQISMIPAIRRANYPAYPLPTATDMALSDLFSRYWQRNMDDVMGLRWFNKAYAELNSDDRIAHLVFGLEQLLVQDDNEPSYLAYKMALRGACLLSPPGQERNNVFGTLRKAYRLRSKIAHGRLNRPLSDDELILTNDVEDILRKIILLWLTDHTRLRAEALDDIVLS